MIPRSALSCSLYVESVPEGERQGVVRGVLLVWGPNPIAGVESLVGVVVVSIGRGRVYRRVVWRERFVAERDLLELARDVALEWLGENGHRLADS